MCLCCVSVVMLLIASQTKLSFASMFDLNKEQIFNSSDLPEDVEFFSHHRFKILKQPTRCSHRSLAKCHISEEMYYSYYDNCYIYACSKKEYYCRNNPNGNTVHICGKSDECQKRRRNIAVRDSVDLDILHVYSVACPVGYFQPNKKICFDSCKKDISIVVNDAVEHESVVARCKSEEGYCNAKHVTYFRIGSENDTCVLALMDLKIRCGEGKELMPDCSCAGACQVNEERDWSESFRCIQKQSSSSVIVADHTTKANVNEFTYRDSSISSQPSYQSTSYQNEKTSDSPNNRKGSLEEKTDNNQSGHLELVVIFVTFVVAVLAIIALAIIAKIRRNTISNSREDGRFTGKDPEAPDMNKKIVGPDNITGTLAQRREHAGHPSSLENLLPQSHSDKSNIDYFFETGVMSALEPKDDQPFMHNLKSPDDQEDESGVNAMLEKTAAMDLL